MLINQGLLHNSVKLYSLWFYYHIVIELLASLRFVTRSMKTIHGGLGTNVAEAF